MPYNAAETTIVQGAAGSFWTKIYQNQDMALLVSAMVHEYEQRMPAALQAEAAVGRQSIQPMRWVPWTLLSPTDAELDELAKLPTSWGDYESPSGSTTVFRRCWNYKLPANLKTVRIVQSSVSNPEKVWVFGQDFYITGGMLVFREDPRPFLQLFQSSDPNVLEHRVWCFGCGVDMNDLFLHFGWAAPATVPEPSDRYKQIINAVWDTRIAGPSSMSLRSAVAASYGVPMATKQETVKTMLVCYGKRVLLTDKSSYTVPLELNWAFQVGDVVMPGDFLVSDLQICDTSGAFAASGAPFLNMPINGGALAFPNSYVPTTYALTSDGLADVRFPVFGVTGTPDSAVDNFWASVVARGIESGISVADLLTVRQFNGETPVSLIRSSVNPASFVWDRVLGGNLVAIVASAALGAPTYALDLRQLLPPYVLGITIPKP